MLAAFIVSLICVVVYLVSTNNVTDKERDEMLNSDEMWP